MTSSVAIVIVSHSADVVKGLPSMVRQMVGANARAADRALSGETRTVQLELPRLTTMQWESNVDKLMRDFAYRLSELMRSKP